jgi:hypothetical protein
MREPAGLVVLGLKMNADRWVNVKGVAATIGRHAWYWHFPLIAVMSGNKRKLTCV